MKLIYTIMTQTLERIVITKCVVASDLQDIDALTKETKKLLNPSVKPQYEKFEIIGGCEYDFRYMTFDERNKR